MARALFQIARGVTTSSLSNGELYYNQTSQSLQVGSDIGTIITLAKINDVNSGSFNISGDLFVSGNTNIVGNLTFGDSNMDTVTVVADFGSNLIPSQSLVYDLGSQTKQWNNAYINSITGSLSGSINGINVTILSTSVDSRLDTLETAGGNDTTRIANLEQHSSSVNSFTASITSSYNATSQSLNSVSSSLFNVSSSYIATSQSLNNVSTSVGLLQTFSSSQYNSDSTSFDGRLDSIENYTSSLKTAIELTGSSVTIQGDLLVRGTTTQVESTIVNIADNILVLNAAGTSDGGLLVRDATGISTTSGSLLWDVTNDYWKVGKSGSESQIGTTADISNLSASLYFTNTTQSVSHSIVSASAWGAFQSASSYSSSFYTTINNTTQSVLINSQSAWGAFQSASAYSASIYTRDSNQDTKITEASASAWGAFQSASSDSSSFNTRISASTLTFNDTNGQPGIDFTHIGTQVSAIASGLTSTSNVQFNNITASGFISASGTIYADTIVVNSLGSTTMPLTQYTTQGTLGNILIKGDTSKSIHVIDTITFTGITETPGNSSQATGLLMTGSITASTGFSGSSISVGKVIANDITASGNLYVSGTIYAYELHTIIESSSVIFSSGSTNFGDQQSDIFTITGSLNQTGSTLFSELTGSLFTFSTSVDSRLVTNSASAWGAFQSASSYSASLAASITGSSANITLLSQSLYFTDTTQSVNTTIVSQSAWGAFQSASAYSASNFQTDATQSYQITANALTASNETTIVSQSAWGAFQSASSYSGSFYTTINNGITNTTEASASAWGAFQSASSYSGSFYTTINSLSSSIATTDTLFAKLGSANRFNGNQEITGSLTVSGDITAYYSSDERLKDNIELISNPIQKVQKLRGVEFDWNDNPAVGYKAGRHDYGVIAQDVLKVLPELVTQRADSFYAVDYDKIIGLLIEVVKEQEKRIKDLENKIGS